MYQRNGFTLIEVLLALAILISVTSIAVPSVADFIVRLRVDQEISALHRVLMLTKNLAINHEYNVTVCPLDTNQQCTTSWHNKLSVFSDFNKNKLLETNLGERILSTKPAIKSYDKLQYGLNRKALVFGPSGHLVIWGGNATFKYCPKNHADKSRGIVISRAGRLYKTIPRKSDNLNVNRSNKLIICR